jgi:hypothetical protein
MSPADASKRTQVNVEQEVDFGRYASQIAAKWWLPVAGFVLGALIGIGLAKGGHPVYTARATIYLGQPIAVIGNGQLQALATNPSSVREAVRADSSIAIASHRSKIEASELRGAVSTQAVAGSLAKLGQTPLVTVIVTVNPSRPKSVKPKLWKPRKAVAIATQTLAEIAVKTVSGYATAKGDILAKVAAANKRELDAIDRRIDEINKAIAGSQLSETDKLVLLTAANLAEQRRATLADEQLQSKLLLTQLNQVELPKIVTPAHAVKTTARSARNSAIVGALLGLLLGAIAALAVPAFRRS